MPPTSKYDHILWHNLEPPEIDPSLGRLLNDEQAEEWYLVLTARGIATRLRQVAGGWQLAVPAADRERAREELRRFTEENRHWPPALPALAGIGDAWVSACVLALLALFHNITRLRIPLPGLGSPPWMEAGNAHVAAIQAGQWWRLATALTLHTDTRHLLGNILIGGVFIIRLCRDLGSGVGWCLLLLVGFAGNYLNSLIQPLDHRSVGASTAIFGAIGILAALNARRHQLHLLKSRPLNWMLPLAAALALLALLGIGDERTDLLAHLFGFLCGLVAGWLVAPLPHASPRLNRLLALGSTAFIILAWWLALRPV